MRKPTVAWKAISLRLDLGTNGTTWEQWARTAMAGKDTNICIRERVANHLALKQVKLVATLVGA